ncbi:MAG: glycosyltransferase family 9 protein [Candidatus Tectomicrobia bacterium]|uniref:Glycosyltransferase family 9 protein n=1 Tax=Tectimicrobiota bacterium TaxID=2528274 RepID=A0A932CQ32_UNCTE|nr:glycosyltransferase family 9 protein [Candidatus Tectomicrobia bacterium]
MSDIPIRRILVVRAGAVGDTILLLPTLRALRLHYPGAYLELMGYSERVEIAGHPPFYAHQTSSCEAPGLSALYRPEGDLPESQRARLGAFDLILAFRPDPEGILARNLRRTGAKRVLVHPPLPAPGQILHASRHLLMALEPLGIRCEGMEAPIGLEEQDRAGARTFWEQHAATLSRWGAGPRVALHAGSGGPKKQWPVERFVQVGRRWARDGKANLLLISGPADRSVIQYLAAGLKAEDPLIVEGLSLRTLAAVLEGCDLYLGNDSGISHLAAALGIRTLVLFGPTDPRVWAPLGPQVTLLSGKAPCAPCQPEVLQGCPWPHCLQGIKAEEVIDAARPWIRERAMPGD